MSMIQVRIYESINFKEFVKLLSAFSSRASKDTKLAYMFLVYDVDGDGRSSRVPEDSRFASDQAQVTVLFHPLTLSLLSVLHVMQ